jgi:hypothetical protein
LIISIPHVKTHSLVCGFFFAMRIAIQLLWAVTSHS